VAKLIIMQKAWRGRFTISGMDFRAIMHIRFHRDYIPITLLSPTICERQADASGSPTPLNFPMSNGIAYSGLASHSGTDGHSNERPVFSSLMQCILLPSMPTSDTCYSLGENIGSARVNATEIGAIVRKKFSTQEFLEASIVA